MMNGGFDPASDARFRATVEIEQKHFWRQIELLWITTASGPAR
jgi:hypothetical protein